MIKILEMNDRGRQLDGSFLTEFVLSDGRVIQSVFKTKTHSRWRRYVGLRIIRDRITLLENDVPVEAINEKLPRGVVI